MQDCKMRLLCTFVLYTKEDLKNRLIKKYSYLKTACNQLSGLEENNLIVCDRALERRTEIAY